MCEAADQASGPLERARRVQLHAAAFGFDWPDTSGVLHKVREETDEIQGALERHDMIGAQRELGDLLFSAVNLARFLNVDPRAALAHAVARFEQRFELLRETIERSGRSMKDCSLEQLDEVWERVKTGKGLSHQASQEGP